MKNKPDSQYLIPDRLADVIRILVVLAVDKHSFRSEVGLEGILRGKPKSAISWLELANEHPEFFRFNKEQTSIVLLIRFLQKVDVTEGELREPLTVEQTEKLVDQAIALHDKQLARYQRDSSKNAITAAYIAAFSTVLVGVFTWFSSMDSNKDIKTNIEVIEAKLDKLEIEVTNTQKEVIKPTNTPKSQNK